MSNKAKHFPINRELINEYNGNDCNLRITSGVERLTIGITRVNRILAYVFRQGTPFV